ncbi:hypothetical protein [Halorussus sp. AFM4]|uniref:hypothetical protein n=1 Tax=Halorussus sp. AFM4 TaxID=3421651 RepID=UPI003EC130CF
MLRNALGDREVRFYVELLYGLLFVGGFAFLAFEVDPRVAAFEGGLVVGYLLRVWEKMSIYERVLERAVSEEAEEQVATELDERVGERVDTEVRQQMDGVSDRIDEEVAAQVDEQVEAEVEQQVDAELDEQVEAEVEQQVERALETESGDEREETA